MTNKKGDISIEIIAKSAIILIVIIVVGILIYQFASKFSSNNTNTLNKTTCEGQNGKCIALTESCTGQVIEASGCYVLTQKCCKP